MRAAPLLLIALAQTGCGRYCTLMYAPSSLTVEFDGTWAPGTWEIELEGYTRHAMCVVTLPRVEGDPLYCTDNVIALEVSEDGGAVERITIWEYTPDAFVVTLHHDEDLVAEQDFRPDYDVDEPNGPGCGERRVATLAMAF